MISKNMVATQTWKIGDCIELMQELDDEYIDLIVTDPPYNIDNQGKINLVGGGKLELVNYNHNFFNIETISMFANKLKPNGSMVIFFDSKMVTEIWYTMKKYNIKPKQIIYWYKGTKGINPRKNFNSTIETAVWGVKGKDYTWNGGGTTSNCFIEKWHELNYPPNNFHPTQKPVAIIKWLVGLLSNECDLICDPFLGSGTTLEACRKTNRNCIGFEIDPQWEHLYPDRCKIHTPPLQSYFGNGELD